MESLAGQNHSYHSDQASSIINPVASSRKALMKPCSLTNIALLYRTAGSFLATLCYPSCCGHDGSGCRSHFPHLMIHDRSRPSTLRTRSPLLFAPHHQVRSSSHMMLKYYFPTEVRPHCKLTGLVPTRILHDFNFSSQLKLVSSNVSAA